MNVFISSRNCTKQFFADLIAKVINHKSFFFISGKSANKQSFWSIYDEELNNLQRSGLESLLQIRAQLNASEPLSRAQWGLLLIYAQSGLEGALGLLPSFSKEGYIALLCAFKEMHKHRSEPRNTKLNYSYLVNMAMSYFTNSYNDENVHAAICETIKRITEAPAEDPYTPVLCARNFLLLLANETITDDAVNTALEPYSGAIWSGAARGYYVRNRTPIRSRRIISNAFWKSTLLESEKDGINLKILYLSNTELYMKLQIDRDCTVDYTLPDYLHIMAFLNALLSRGKKYIYETRNCFRVLAIGEKPNFYKLTDCQGNTTISINHEDWETMKFLLSNAMQQPEVEKEFSRLATEYGEV